MSKHQELWIELPPPGNQKPNRLMIFVHAGTTSTEAFLPVAIHWHLKFPSSSAVVLHAPQDPTGRRGWIGTPNGNDAEEFQAAVVLLTQRIRAAQTSTGLGAASTLIVAHGVGALIALEMLRQAPDIASALVGYGARLRSSGSDLEPMRARIHLIHGSADTIVPVEFARRAAKHLQAAGSEVTLDIIEDATHWIDQDMINLGTQRFMQTLFRGRRSKPPTLH